LVASLRSEAVGLGEGAEAVLEDEEAGCEEDEEGDDRLERGTRRREQNCRASDGAEDARSDEQQHAAALSLEFGAIGEGPTQVAGPEGDGVGDVCGLRGIADGQQRRKGDERAAAGDGVDRAGREGGSEHGDAFEEGHEAGQSEIGNREAGAGWL
jgi:hypothetical protein